MKQILFLTIAILGFQRCNPGLQSYSGEVNFLYKESQGTIAVKSLGYGRNQTEAVTDAQINAFKVLLFRGLPGTELNTPLIENEKEARSRNGDYFDSFFDKDHYKTFLMSSTESSNLIKMKGTKKISVDLKINYASLRRDLEQNQIIRKFGY